jgi:multisubunit Na+/H+ antiporter MnhB subunit
VVLLAYAIGKEFLLDRFGPEHDTLGLSNPDGVDGSLADFLGYIVGGSVAGLFLLALTRIIG